MKAITLVPYGPCEAEVEPWRRAPRGSLDKHQRVTYFYDLALHYPQSQIHFIQMKILSVSKNVIYVSSFGCLNCLRNSRFKIECNYSNGAKFKPFRIELRKQLTGEPKVDP